MAEPGTEASDISLRAADVAADVSETDHPQERRRLVKAFTTAAGSGARAAGSGARAAGSGARAAGSGARAAGRGTRAAQRGAGSGTRAARQRASAGTGYLVAQVIDMAPRLRVRDQAALQAQFPGRSPEEIADALIEGAVHASAAAGGAAGVVSALPVLPAFPAEIVAETLVVVGIEIKLIAELHEAYGTPVPGKLPVRMSAYLAAWAHRRGVSMIPGGVIFAAGSPLMRLLRRRLAARAGRSAFSLGPLLTGAAAGAFMNSWETRKLGQQIRNDLRRRALSGPERR
jgi:hypothetical protein